MIYDCFTFFNEPELLELRDFLLRVSQKLRSIFAVGNSFFNNIP